MLGSVHLVDGGARATLAVLRRVPTPADTPGLREARGLVAAPIGGRLPAPQPGRSGLVAFWDDAAALDAFLATDPQAYARTTSGHTRAMREDGRRTFHHAGSFVRLRPLAATGHLDGRNPLPASVTEALLLPVP